MTRRRQEKGAVKVMNRHLPQRDPTIPVDTGGHWWCTCSLPNYHPVHDLPDTPEHVIDAEARRYGEAG